MKKSLAFLLICPLLTLSQNSKPFKVIGTYSLDNNKEIRIYEAIFDSAYNDYTIEKNEVTVRDNKFEIRGTVKYATPFQFSYFLKEERRGIVSDLLFIEGGSVDINLKDFTKDNNIVINSNSKANLEYQQLRMLYRHLENHSSDIDRFEAKDIEAKDSILELYIKSNSNSYVAMWILISDYAHFGYTELISNISALFSDEIKSTKTFQTFERRLQIDRNIVVGDKFPFYQFSFGEDLKNTVRQSHYTFIDFWASYCKPCIAQFPDLSKIYTSYHSKGFAIYAISIDKKRDVAKMKNIIERKGIMWPNVLDDNGKESGKLDISGIPVNFLVDSEGKIIAKNISAEILEAFLKKKNL